MQVSVRINVYSFRTALLLIMLFLTCGCVSRRCKPAMTGIKAEFPPPTFAESARGRLAALLEEMQALPAGTDTMELENGFAAFLEAYPEHWQALDEFADFLYDRGRGEQALAYWERALEIRPYAADIHNSIGVLISHENRFLEAIDRFRMAAELRPDIAMYHFNLGTLYFTARFELQKRESWTLPEIFWKSQAAYERAFQLEPDNYEFAVSCWRNYIMARHFQVHDTEAQELAACKRSLKQKLNPRQKAYAYTHLARIHSRLGDRKQALKWIHKAIRLHDTGMSRTVLGNILQMPD